MNDSSEKRGLLRRHCPFKAHSFIDPVQSLSIGSAGALWRWIVGVLMRSDCNRTENMWLPRSPTERTRPDDQGKGKGTVTVWHPYNKRKESTRLTHINEQKIILKRSETRKPFRDLARPLLDLPRRRGQRFLSPDNRELFTVGATV